MISRKPDPTKPMQFRQGDVFLVKVDTKPATAKLADRDNGRIVLAYGEVTGHSHAIAEKEDTANLYIEGARRFLEICGNLPAHLKHEEHATITLEPGIYEVIQQREYDCLQQMSRQVID